MSNKNKEELYYSMDFYLGCPCGTEQSELNNVSIRSKKLDSLAKRLNLISDFRNNVFDVSIFKCKKGSVEGLVYVKTIEEIEDWFNGNGIEL